MRAAVPVAFKLRVRPRACELPRTQLHVVAPSVLDAFNQQPCGVEVHSILGTTRSVVL